MKSHSLQSSVPFFYGPLQRFIFLRFIAQFCMLYSLYLERLARANLIIQKVKIMEKLRWSQINQCLNLNLSLHFLTKVQHFRESYLCGITLPQLYTSYFLFPFFPYDIFVFCLYILLSLSFYASRLGNRKSNKDYQLKTSWMSSRQNLNAGGVRPEQLQFRGIWWLNLL